MTLLYHTSDDELVDDDDIVEDSTEYNDSNDTNHHSEVLVLLQQAKCFQDIACIVHQQLPTCQLQGVDARGIFTP